MNWSFHGEAMLFSDFMFSICLPLLPKYTVLHNPHPTSSSLFLHPLNVVNMKITVLCEVTPCNMLQRTNDSKETTA
jgi:hypothetical protein